jgi:hypothetical protein
MIKTAPTLLEEIVTKEQGGMFVKSGRDTNPIHTNDDNIVPGLLLACHSIKQFRLKNPQYSSYKLSYVHIKFNESVHYNERVTFPHKFEHLTDSSIIVKGIGEKPYGAKPFMELEMICKDNLEPLVEKASEQASENSNFITYEREITAEDVEGLCGSINIDYELFKVSYIKEFAMKQFFLSTFVAGALCKRINPNELPEGKVPVFAEQKFNFYDFPSEDFDRIKIILKRAMDNRRGVKVNEDCYIDNYTIIKGLSFILKVDKSKIMASLEKKR